MRQQKPKIQGKLVPQSSGKYSAQMELQMSMPRLSHSREIPESSLPWVMQFSELQGWRTLCFWKGWRKGLEHNLGCYGQFLLSQDVVLPAVCSYFWDPQARKQGRTGWAKATWRIVLQVGEELLRTRDMMYSRK